MGKIKYLVLIVLFSIAFWFFNYYQKAMEFMDKFTHGYKINSVKSDVVKNIALLATGTGHIDLSFSIWIKNPTKFAVTITGLEIDFYHKGLYIGNSTKYSPVIIKSNETSTFNGSAKFYLNKALLQTALAASSKVVRLDYVARFKVFGFPFYLKYKSFYNVNVLDYI